MVDGAAGYRISDFWCFDRILHGFPHKPLRVHAVLDFALFDLGLPHVYNDDEDGCTDGHYCHFS